MINNLILDVDSTVLGAEVLEELFILALPNVKTRKKIIKEVNAITDLGMTGKIPFNESLQKRVAMLSLTRSVLKKAAKLLANKVSESFIKNLDLFRRKNVFFISGSFMEVISPILTDLGFRKEQIFANNFIFNKGEFLGVDISNPLSQAGGKVLVTRNLGLNPEETLVIGDGNTDFEIKQEGLVKAFVYYGEFVIRENVRQKADYFIGDFSQLGLLLNGKPLPLGVNVQPIFVN